MKPSEEQLLIGIHAVSSALKTAAGDVEWLRVLSDSHNKRLLEIESRAHGSGIKVIKSPLSELDRLSGQQRHQGVIAGFKGSNVASEGGLEAILDSIEGTPLILVLDGIQDPHNLGACLRTADAAGVHLVVICKDRSASITPVVRRAASGAAETLKVIQATNLARVLRILKKKGIWLAGTSDEATDSLYATDLTGPLALVMGSEGSGLRRLTTEICDYLLRIPMAGQVESLNVSVATGVCLYEINRQRQTN
ncbi:MAG: 23S rRNA (guanosine(2251)-2'-O)-methyltransferase RlmB [Xanthomonadales bacterium]|nr:23S rRNA (guanosine(2251)-2'-O)-methyltransferase RlmB [Xanthomonadales bacterium]